MPLQKMGTYGKHVRYVNGDTGRDYARASHFDTAASVDLAWLDVHYDTSYTFWSG